MITMLSTRHNPRQQFTKSWNTATHPFAYADHRKGKTLICRVHKLALSICQHAYTLHSTVYQNIVAQA